MMAYWSIQQLWQNNSNPIKNSEKFHVETSYSYFSCWFELHKCQLNSYLLDKGKDQLTHLIEQFSTSMSCHMSAGSSGQHSSITGESMLRSHLDIGNNMYYWDRNWESLSNHINSKSHMGIRMRISIEATGLLTFQKLLSNWHSLVTLKWMTHYNVLSNS